MRLIPIEDADESMVLAKPIPKPDKPNMDLLKKGFKLTDVMIEKLNQIGVKHLWIIDDDLEFLDELIDERLEVVKRDIFSDVKEHFDGMMSGRKENFDYSRYAPKIKDLFDGIFSNPSSVNFLQDLNTYDNYLAAHSFNVCYLSILLGVKAQSILVKERGTKEAFNDAIHNLGVGAIFHDLGKTELDKGIAVKPLGHSKEERRELVKHVFKGYEILKDRISPTAANISLNHHQKFNGTGYPALKGDVPLLGKGINIFSRLVSIVNIYDCLTAPNPYVPNKQPVQALYYIKFGLDGWFDPEIKFFFEKLVPPFPVGSFVKLNTAETAAVVELNNERPCDPVVKLYSDINGNKLSSGSQTKIDLSREKDINVKYYNGVDIEKYLY